MRGIILLLFAGCSPASLDDYTPAIAHGLSEAVLTVPNLVPLAPVQPVVTVPRSECDCDSGWRTHGDGHRTRCTKCEEGLSRYGLAAGRDRLHYLLPKVKQHNERRVESWGRRTCSGRSCRTSFYKPRRMSSTVRWRGRGLFRRR